MFNKLKILLLFLLTACFSLTTTATTVDESTHLRTSQIEPVQIQNESANLADTPASGHTLQRTLSQRYDYEDGEFFSLADCSIAPKSGQRLLNSPIKQTPKGMKHVLDRHTVNDISRYASKSKFSVGEDVGQLIRQSTQQPMVCQANGNFARTFDVDRQIGIDRATRQATSTMTVITKPDGTLVTAFPGRP